MTDPIAYLPRILVDFDDVIHDYTGSGGWQGHGSVPGDPVPGALPWLASLVGVMEVCIYSTRSAQVGGLRAMERWLAYHWDGAELRAVDLAKIQFSDKKLPAKLTLDDRAIRFTGRFPLPQELLAYETWAEATATLSDHESRSRNDIAERAGQLLLSARSYRRLAHDEWMRPQWRAHLLGIADQVEELAHKLERAIVLPLE